MKRNYYKKLLAVGLILGCVGLFGESADPTVPDEVNPSRDIIGYWAIDGEEFQKLPMVRDSPTKPEPHRLRIMLRALVFAFEKDRMVVVMLGAGKDERQVMPILESRAEGRELRLRVNDRNNEVHVSFVFQDRDHILMRPDEKQGSGDKVLFPLVRSDLHKVVPARDIVGKWRVDMEELRELVSRHAEMKRPGAHAKDPSSEPVLVPEKFDAVYAFEKDRLVITPNNTPGVAGERSGGYFDGNWAVGYEAEEGPPPAIRVVTRSGGAPMKFVVVWVDGRHARLKVLDGGPDVPVYIPLVRSN